MRRRWLPAVAALLVLAGCGEGGWLGESEDPPLPGKRVAVMLLDPGPQADARLANLSIVLPPPESNDAWPQAGGSATHMLGHLAVGETIDLAWRADIGSGSSGRVRLLGPPVVAQGRVFTIDSEGTIRAFASTDGSLAWSFEADGIEDADRLTGGALAWADGRLFAVYAHGDVLALDAASGAEVWRQRVRAPVRTSPTVARDRLLVITADNQLFALDAGGGQILWAHAGIFEQAAILGGASPAATGELVIVAYSSGEVFALRLSDGQPIWSETVLRPRRTVAIGALSDIVGDPVIDGDRVVVAGNGGEMAAFDLLRGSRVWEVELTSLQTPWAAGDFVYALTERSEVVCLLRQGGRIRWVSPLNATAEGEEAARADASARWVGPVLAGDRLVLASSRGEVASLSPYTGELLGKAELAGPVSLPPVVAERTVYFLTDDGELLAYR
jgi:outer membrane protein assembly factor BamB